MRSYPRCKTIGVSEAEGIYIKCDLGNQRLAFNPLVSRQGRVPPKGQQERLERCERYRELKTDAHSRKLELSVPFPTHAS